MKQVYATKGHLGTATARREYKRAVRRWRRREERRLLEDAPKRLMLKGWW